MKIIFLFLPYMAGGGAQRVFVNLANRLSLNQDKWKVYLVTIDSKGPYTAQLNQAVDIIELKASRVIFALFELAALLKKVKPSVLISGLNYANVAAVYAVKLSRVETCLILTEHNNFSVSVYGKPLIFGFLLRQAMKAAYRSADWVVAVSKGVANDLLSNLGSGLLQEKLRVIYNPVVDSQLLKLADDQVEHRWFRQVNTTVILAVGRLVDQKDYPNLLRAFALLEHDNLRLLILGEGDKRKDIEDIVEKLGLQEKVELKGFVNNPYAYMARSSLFVLSSRFEGFGNVIVEAMACGLPVISTDCRFGPKEIIAHGENGILVPVGDPEALANAINCVLNDDKLRKKLSAKAVERAWDFSTEKITPQYESLFLSTLLK